MVCTMPSVVAKIMAKFVSPVDVREKLLKSGRTDVSMLNESDVGTILRLEKQSHSRYNNALLILE